MTIMYMYLHPDFVKYCVSWPDRASFLRVIRCWGCDHRKDVHSGIDTALVPRFLGNGAKNVAVKG